MACIMRTLAIISVSGVKVCEIALAAKLPLYYLLGFQEYLGCLLAGCLDFIVCGSMVFEIVGLQA